MCPNYIGFKGFWTLTPNFEPEKKYIQEKRTKNDKATLTTSSFISV